MLVAGVAVAVRPGKEIQAVEVPRLIKVTVAYVAVLPELDHFAGHFRQALRVIDEAVTYRPLRTAFVAEDIPFNQGAFVGKFTHFKWRTVEQASFGLPIADQNDWGTFAKWAWVELNDTERHHAFSLWASLITLPMHSSSSSDG